VTGTARSTSRRSTRLSVGAVTLLVLGVVFGALYHVENGREHHSYNAGAKAPDLVRVTLGKQYEVSTPGGIDALIHHGVSIDSISCTYSQAGTGSSSRELDTTALGSSTRTVHAVATFVAPVTGDIHLACQGFTGGVFVDDADDVAADPAGLLLLLATIALTIGAALALSVLYRREPAGREPGRRSHQQQEYGRLLAGGGDGPDTPPDESSDG
jgi:hypothetical protein